MVNAQSTRPVCCKPLSTRIVCNDCKATLSRTTVPHHCPFCRGEDLEVERRLYRIERHTAGRFHTVARVESVTALKTNERAIVESWDHIDEQCVECHSFACECHCGTTQAEALPVPQMKALAFAIRSAMGAGDMGKIQNALNAMDRLLEHTPMAAPVEVDEFARAMCLV